MKKILIAFCILFFATAAYSQSINVYPTHWWAGMKWNKVQLMVHGEKIAEKFPMFTMSAAGVKLATGVRLMKINRVENPNYLFLDLVIEPSAKPGKFNILLSNDTKLLYELKPRRNGNGSQFAQGVTSKDFIYLILPDRFSNGDVTNDKIPGMRDQSLNRDTVFNRHGGDLKGVQNHLDYLQQLGVTTIWLNPVIENDRKDRTEHGYAFTNHYTIDKRLGGENAYKNLIDATHAKGLKIIQDAVYNHVDENHVTIIDMPMKDWVHQWPIYTNTTYKDQVVFDPYASKADKKQMVDGWFTRQMPDINQNNTYVANYLIQHAIYTVEEFGIDGWRVDTYAYNDLPFMNRCNSALYKEYPQLTIFGETWFHGVANQAYVTENIMQMPFKSNLQGATDFQTLWGIQDAMTKDFGWTDGVNNLYTILAQDYLYKDPTRNVVFLDNHDMARFFSVVGEDINKYKSALTWLFTCRGIPQMYYGSEMATTGFTSPSDGYVRLDFPGGWPGDKINKFEPQGRTIKDEQIFGHVAYLANFRKKSSALTTGKMMQFLPVDGLYVYFRYDDKQTIMVVMNTSKETKNVQFDLYNERTNGFTKYIDHTNARVGSVQNKVEIGSYQTIMFELK